MARLRFFLATLIATFLALCSSAALATECDERQPVGVAVVIGGGRAYFRGDASHCPKGQAYCLRRAYVIAGDRVLTMGSQDGFTCVAMPSKDDTTTGWIETKRLQSEAVNASPPLSAWEGVWTSESVMRIAITRDQRGLRALGIDHWLNGDGREHNAQFSGRLSVTGAHARLTGGDCDVELTLLNGFLLVEDQTSCEPNTSFRGTYQRNR